ncbi:SUMF1/EgtB/PvdO family nonheme iron enzyme, partial [bacterium]|nr:SUMF1/EgtB/PvdO family nonheme iron enzyme [bacterium]
APVTQAEYMSFVRWSGHSAPGMTEEEWEEQGFLAHPYSEVAKYTWRGTRHPTDRQSHPVVLVSRLDAEAYAAWLSARTGCLFRLPTALEWERASRGEDGQHYPWGDEWDAKLLNAGFTVGGTSPVGAYPGGASPHGLLDTVGNVFEWTADQSAAGEAIVKGCSWDDLPAFCRPAYWHVRPPRSRHILIGFRLVRRMPALPDVPAEPLGDPPDPDPG